MPAAQNGIASAAPKPLNQLFDQLPTTVFSVMTALSIKHNSINLGQGDHRITHSRHRADHSDHDTPAPPPAPTPAPASARRTGRLRYCHSDCVRDPLPCSHLKLIPGAWHSLVPPSRSRAQPRVHAFRFP